MATTTKKSVYFQGMRDGAPFLLVVGPFALLFGVVATEAGLNVYETLAFSIVVIAGAAQFTALQLLTENVPTVIVLASALAVNLRMAMYSASLTPYIGAAPIGWRALAAYFTIDQSYALSIVKFENEPYLTLAQRYAYFFGIVTLMIPGWYAMTVVGALVGKSIPPEYALDFAVPITFIAMIAPALRSVAHVAAAMVSVMLALCFTWVPYNLGLLIAAFGAMMIGARVELIMTRKAAL